MAGNLRRCAGTSVPMGQAWVGKPYSSGAAFPQAAASTMQALRSTSLNLNPQQDGLKIYVSLPKVTREHRESVAKAAKSRSVHL